MLIFDLSIDPTPDLPYNLNLNLSFNTSQTPALFSNEAFDLSPYLIPDLIFNLILNLAPNLSPDPTIYFC